MFLERQFEKANRETIREQPNPGGRGGSDFGIHTIGLQEHIQAKLIAVFILRVALGARSWDIVELS
ncbi:hypothetical protein N7491_008502 [Penicillium cf. griseofulvum]|uniref:Uncharacterized protein n=1 Tax=Penicillium cf. griseofulvum TaxID=2972120 RepID=A0A9W9MG71_9EURO|nr:hypothetical protein N7472_005896 [Penicillium cf. griseofulvum]KAJ5423286.1 hypothetical protein N7491_008502 [Penicillium cf. griseofulvum]KAJ5431441.1 hypothetical protein N7445_009173 [Penicillium cf. griseofulvum]